MAQLELVLEITSENANKVFVCYSRKDVDFVMRLVGDLERAGIDTWIDQKDIPVGVSWDREVESALKVTRTTLIVLSPNSVDSENVRDEISVAVDDRDHIVPVLYKKCEIPLRIRRHQYVDFTAGYRQALVDELVAHLRHKRGATFEVVESLPPMEPSARSRKRVTWVASLVAMVVAGGVLYLSSARDSVNEVTDDSELQVAAGPPLPPVEDKTPAPCDLKRLRKEMKVTGSSSQEKWPPNLVNDGDRTTAWCEDDSGPGRREWLEFSLEKRREIRKIGITSGWVATSKKRIDLFTWNSHIRTANITFDGIGDTRVTFNRGEKYKEIKVNQSAQRIHVLIEDVWEVDKSKDLCISEIDIWGLVCD